MIVNHWEIVERVKELWHRGGLPRGALPGWPSLNALYTVADGQWTMVTGLPGSGKSEFLDAVMVNLALKGNWKFVIFSPENWPLETHHAKVIEKYIGKPFAPGPTERLDEVELDDAAHWMHGKFLFAKLDHPDMLSILNEANDYRGAGSYKFGVVIDPWNHLEHYRPQGRSETEYVSQVLSEVIAWVRERNCHLWLVAHPAKLQRDKAGELPVPTPNDVSGSAHFWNKADNCLTVWRNQNNYHNQEVRIYVQKVRFKHCGHTGIAKLRYDRVTGRYHEWLQAVPGTEKED